MMYEALMVLIDAKIQVAMSASSSGPGRHADWQRLMELQRDFEDTFLKEAPRE